MAASHPCKESSDARHGLHGMEQVRVAVARLERCQANGLAYHLLHRLASRATLDAPRRAAPPLTAAAASAALNPPCTFLVGRQPPAASVTSG